MMNAFFAYVYITSCIVSSTMRSTSHMLKRHAGFNDVCECIYL